MDVFWHNNVAGNNKLIFLPDFFESGFEEVSGFRGGQIGQAMVTTECEEMHLAGILVTNEPFGHGLRINLAGRLVDSQVRKSGPGAPRFVGEKKRAPFPQRWTPELTQS
ncbi:MAG: hypothetical protein WB608_08760, partial [Terracidiphilus sp.]